MNETQQERRPGAVPAFLRPRVEQRVMARQLVLSGIRATHATVAVDYRTLSIGAVQ